MKPLIAGTVSKLTYLKTNNGERLTERKLALMKTDDGVQYEGKELSYHAGMDSD